MSEANKEKARRFVEEAFGQGKLEVVEEVLDPNFVCYDPNPEAGEVRGADNNLLPPGYRRLARAARLLEGCAADGGRARSELRPKSD